MSEQVAINEYYQGDNIYSQFSNKQELINSETQIIQYFNKMKLKETEPTTQYIHESIYEEDLSIVIDEVVNLIFKELNQGKEENVIKQHVLVYINNYNLHLKEIFIWLLNNQFNSNSIYLFGYFHYYGIETKIDKQNAFELYLKAAELGTELGNNLAQLELVNMYMDGEGVEKDHIKAFELSKDLEKGGTPSGINKLGYCYGNGIGTDINVKKAFELYQKAADLGNIRALCNLGLFYKNGKVVTKDNDKAFELFKKSAEGEFSGGITMLGRCYELGIGISSDKKKAFELYQKAANLENDVAQYNLALMYEIGNGIKNDVEKAIYWYKKSAEQGNKYAQNKLSQL
jgi:TPR repeat protein